MDRAAYDLARYYRRRQWAINYLGARCIDCGDTESLEFDHVDPATKLYDVSSILLHGNSKILAELDKCVLRCREHHQVRSTLQQSVEHGGGLTGKKNCKCRPCKDRKAKYMREWKRTHKPT